MIESNLWIKDILDAARENPTQEAVSLIEQCGRSCSRRKGHAEGVKKMKEAAAWCKTRSDYIQFLKEHISDKVAEAEDGILIPLGKEKCTCPMAEFIDNPMLCCCTQGNNKETWGELFGPDVKVEMAETFMRGGKDCVIKIYID